MAEEAPPEEEETPLQKQSKWRDPDLVPDRYKGYEELLDGPTDPDFINPVGKFDPSILLVSRMGLLAFPA